MDHRTLKCWTASITAAAVLCLGSYIVGAAEVGLGLYAVSDAPHDQFFSAVQAIIAWDPEYLRLVGTDQTDAIGLFSQGFMLGDAFGLNEACPPADGDGLWAGLNVLGHIGPPVSVAIVPEPGGFGLFMVALLAVQGARWRRRTNGADNSEASAC